MSRKSKNYYYSYGPNELFNRIKYIYTNKFYNLFMNSLEWDGLTKEEEDYIMKKFWATGTLAAFNMENIGTVFAPYAVQGYGLYDVPTDVTIINVATPNAMPTKEKVAIAEIALSLPLDFMYRHANKSSVEITCSEISQ